MRILPNTHGRKEGFELPLDSRASTRLHRQRRSAHRPVDRQLDSPESVQFMSSYLVDQLRRFCYFSCCSGYLFDWCVASAVIHGDYAKLIQHFARYVMCRFRGAIRINAKYVVLVAEGIRHLICQFVLGISAARRSPIRLFSSSTQSWSPLRNLN